MPNFLDEINGGFVAHTLADTAIAAIVDKRVFPEVAPLNTDLAHLIYTQSAGRRIKSHQGVSSGGAANITLHVYAIGRSQPQANTLAQLVEDRWLAANNVTAAGVLVQTCNGGQYDGGQWFAKDSSENHLFYRRVVLAMLIGQ